MYDPRFLFVRYCPGSCGNFLISVLQQNDTIAHWNPVLETQRSLDNWKIFYVNWFKSRFQSDLHNHLKFEPHHPYKLDFVSAKHARGDDMSTQDFLAALIDRNDMSFFNAVEKKQFVCLRLHKSRVPTWGTNSRIVNIVVDPASQKWFHRSRAVKLFGKVDEKFIMKENDPEFLKHKFDRLYYRNNYEFPINQYRFIRNFVIGEPILAVFKSPGKITLDASNSSIQNQIFIKLSDMFDWKLFQQACTVIYKQLNLGTLDTELTRECWRHYYLTHIQPFTKHLSD